MINNTSKDKWTRLNSKNLDSQFMNSIIKGLNCSPFEAKCVLDSVHDVYSDYFNTSKALKPGQSKFIVMSSEEPPSKPLKEANKITVILTIDNGEEDLNIKEGGGVIALRRHRIQRVCNEAFMQGGVLTVEDLANRIFITGERTIIRDIKAFKEDGIILPLRSTIKDMGRSLSHRKIIVDKWLKGKEYSEISYETNHSIEAINNYIKKFKQVVSLVSENYEVNSIAFLVRISKSLAEEYIKLWHQKDLVASRKQELDMLLKKN